jgi:subtilisin family serine protease
MTMKRQPTRRPNARETRHRGSEVSDRTAHAEALEARTLFASTNDPLFASQYALANTAVAGAWDTTRGSAAVVVADIDSGADYTHRDLYANIWINQAEIPTSLRSRLRDADADGRITFYDLNNSANRSLMTDVNRNGYIDAGDLLSPASAGGWEDAVNGRSNASDRYVDDIVGWAFAEGDNDPFDDGSANGGHGTHTAGIIGAMGNNGVGISGVAQKVSMMIARIFTDSGLGTTTARIAQAIRYTADSGARVANASWGSGYGRTGDAMYNAIAYAGTKGQVFVTAAGNGGRNLDSAFFNSYPAEYNLANIVVVGATTSFGNLASYSDYGSAAVDVAAPGSSVLSTVPGNRYAYYSGTSMATPMVTGAVALMLSANRSLTVAQIKQRLIAGTDDSFALNNRSVSDGELNVNNALLNRPGTQITTTLASSSVASDGIFLMRPGLFSIDKIRPLDLAV